MAAVDFFLKIEGVDGESTDDKHKGEIEVESFSWGVSNSGSVRGGGGGGAGKVSFQDIHFTSSVSKASPKLFLSCATGEHIKKAVLTCRKAGADQQQEFYKVVMEDVLVSSYQSAGSAGSLPVDQFSLNFVKIDFSIAPTSPRGT